MAAVEDSDSIAAKAPALSRGAWLGLLTTAAGYALTVLIFYPGYSTVDARYVYADAMAWRFGEAAGHRSNVGAGPDRDDTVQCASRGVSGARC